MNNPENIENLYATISSDLMINQFDNETDTQFICRLVYSAVGRWIMNLFNSKILLDDKKISKIYITNYAINILESFKKIDSDIDDYFLNEKSFINMIENVYCSVGYINDELYYYIVPERSANIKISNKCLVIDIDTKERKMRGLGIWKKLTSLDFSLEKFLFFYENAEEYAKKFVRELKYSKFNEEYGNIELYNIEKNKWDSFSEKNTLKYEYYILKIDNGMDYQMLKRVNDVLYYANVPKVYFDKNEKNFKYEIWRIILGICSLNGKQCKCKVSKKSNNAINIKLCGYALPSLEESLLKCMAWPVGNCLEMYYYITELSMKDAICELLNKLSIVIIEEDINE